MARRDLTFRVFVSSTFADLVEERNALQEGAFPQLREYCRQRGARFQAIDLRWGVSHEAALDQQTMNICIQELRRCQELSPRPNFIVLLGDRYGWRPLPSQIRAGEFEALLAALTDAEQERLLRWYRLDANGVPPEYCLLPRAGEFTDHNRWVQEADGLRAALLKAVETALPSGDPARAKYYDSATHQEICHGALNAAAPQEHVFCYFREIRGLPEDAAAGLHRDLRNGKVDREAHDRLVSLKQELTGLLPLGHVHAYDAEWKGGGPEWNLDKLCADVRSDLQHIIDLELAGFARRPEVDREAEEHREFARQRCCHFVGREDLLKRMGTYLTSDIRYPLIIEGQSGSGKTALMAKAWLDMPEDRKAIVRFIGATPASCDLRSLLASVCLEMGMVDVPTDLNDLVTCFRGRLSGSNEPRLETSEHDTTVLFLDALDQLNPTDSARLLHWLPRELAPDVKLVMSVLAVQGAGGEESVSGDCREAAKHIWPDSLITLGPLHEEDGARLLSTWLAEAGRTLQAEQREDVLDGFASCPTPLYLRLAFEEARRWNSWDSLPVGASQELGLSDTVEGILDGLLARLERPQVHGKHLVSRALAYIATGRHGLTEDELLDILSVDRLVMQDFHARFPDSPTTIRLPVIIWSRLFASVEPYMAHRRADGTTVMSFYHREVREAVERRYLSPDIRLGAHLHLAEYFDGLNHWAESLEAQRRRAKRLPPTPRLANVRKVVELPYHLIEAAKLGGKDDPESEHWDAVADLLTNWEFLEAKAEADPNPHPIHQDEPDAQSGSASGDEL